MAIWKTDASTVGLEQYEQQLRESNITLVQIVEVPDEYSSKVSPITYLAVEGEAETGKKIDWIKVLFSAQSLGLFKKQVIKHLTV